MWILVKLKAMMSIHPWILSAIIVIVFFGSIAGFGTGGEKRQRVAQPGLNSSAKSPLENKQMSTANMPLDNSTNEALIVDSANPKAKLGPTKLGFLSGDQYGTQIDRALVTEDPELALAAVNTIGICERWDALKEAMYQRRAVTGNQVSAEAITYMEKEARACQSISPEHREKARLLASKALLGDAKWSAVAFFKYRKGDVSTAELDAARIGIVRDILACSPVAPAMAVAWKDLGLPADEKEKYRIVARAVLDAQKFYSAEDRDLLDKGARISVGDTAGVDKNLTELAAKQIIDKCMPVYNGSVAP